MEEESSEEEDESPTPVPSASAGSGKKAPPVPMPPREVQQPPPLPPTPDKVVVKKGYDPKQGKSLQGVILQVLATCWFKFEVPGSVIDLNCLSGQKVLTVCIPPW